MHVMMIEITVIAGSILFTKSFSPMGMSKNSFNEMPADTIDINPVAAAHPPERAWEINARTNHEMR
jgi:hypothetical protein